MNLITDTDFLREFKALVDGYRAQCLWFARPDWLPQDVDAVRRCLEAIETHADRQGYCRARELKQWLLRLILAEAARANRFSQVELTELAFDGFRLGPSGGVCPPCSTLSQAV